MGKSFELAVKEKDAEAKDLEYPFDFDLPDRTIRFRRPEPGEAMLLSLAMGRHTPLAEKMAAMIDIFATVLDPKDHDYVVGLILTEKLGPEQLFGKTKDADGILAYMIEEWSGRPTNR